MISTEPPRAKEGNTCPLHQKDMSEVCHKCPLWVKIVGKDPQSEGTIEHWNCSLAWLPILLVENSQMQRQTGAAVESARNENVRSAEIIAGSVNHALSEVVRESKIERENMLAAFTGVIRTLPLVEGRREIPRHQVGTG